MNRTLRAKKRMLSLLFILAMFALTFSVSANETQAATIPTIKYQAHVQNTGWMSTVKGGKTAGTTGKSMRLEALKITLVNKKTSMIQYRAHVSNVGWQTWKKSGQVAGTTGKGYAIEAVQIKLTGAYAKKYDVYYRVHVPHKGWLGWAKNGATAGSTGMGLRTEAIQIKLVKKGKLVSIGGKVSLSKPSFSYKGYSQSTGWGRYVGDGSVTGTTGQGKRLEAIILSFKNFDGGNGITYRVHVSNIGWQNWVNSGKTAGTTGQNKQIEAVQIKLAGGMENFFDIYYRMHVAQKGWLGWAKNGEMAGTTGGGIRAEAIQIRIVAKGASFDMGGISYFDESKPAIPKVNAYSSGVQKGTIRRVSQKSNLINNGWVYSGCNFTSVAGWECGAASSSMAASYLGVNISPGEICYRSGGGSLTFDTLWINWSGVSSAIATGASFATYFNRYVNDTSYKYSPVIIHLTKYPGTTTHYVVVIGKNSNGTYKIADPVDVYSTWDATITGSYITGLNGGVSCSIDKIIQCIK